MNNKTFNYFKRILAVIVSVAMTMSMLSACSDNDTDYSSKSTEHNVPRSAIQSASQAGIQGESQADIQSMTESAGSSGVSVTIEDVSFDSIAESCSQCEEAMKYMIAIAKAFKHLKETTEDKNAYIDKIDELQQKVYDLMQHDCHAETIHVENFPLCFYRYYGSYTGDWKGAGPVGYGTFVGDGLLEELNKDWQINHYQYEGEWKGGVPYGNGQFYSEYTLLNTDGSRVRTYLQDYSGEMKMGLKDGVGTQYEETYEGDYRTMRYYETGYYEKDCLQGTVEFAEYDASGTLLKAGTAIHGYGTAIDGVSGPTRLWDNEVTYDREVSIEKSQEFLGFALGVMAIIGGIFLANNLSVDDYNPQSAEQAQQELNQYFANKEAEAHERAKREEQERESYRQYCEDRYYALHAADPDDWSLDAQYFGANM